jgi:hypothetical protein
MAAAATVSALGALPGKADMSVVLGAAQMEADVPPETLQQG